MRSSERARVAFETGGIVTRLDVELGDSFQRGNVLGEIDDTALRLDLEAAASDLSDATAQLEDARLAYDRRRALQGTGAVSQAAIDQARSQYESALARVSGLEARRGRAAERLSDTKLVAPFNGEVVARHVEPGELINAGTPVFDIVNTASRLEAIVHVPDRLRASMKIGDTIDVVVLSSYQQVEGRISEIGFQAGPAGLYPVTVALASEDLSNAMKPGQAVEVHLPVRRGSDIVIPESAYALDANGQAYVFSLAEDRQTLERLDVELGSPVSGGIEIRSGLAAGTLIVTRGADLLKDGETVDPISTGIARYNR